MYRSTGVELIPANLYRRFNSAIGCLFQRQSGVQRSPYHAEGAFFALLVGRPKGGDSLYPRHDRATISMSLGFF